MKKLPPEGRTNLMSAKLEKNNIRVHRELPSGILVIIIRVIFLLARADLYEDFSLQSASFTFKLHKIVFVSSTKKSCKSAKKIRLIATCTDGQKKIKKKCNFDVCIATFKINIPLYTTKFMEVDKHYFYPGIRP